jgi:hypothetical protein
MTAQKLHEDSPPEVKYEQSHSGGTEQLIELPPSTENEKNIIKVITNKLQENFWKYYKEKKIEMIEDAEVSSQDNNSFFKDEHGDFDSGESGDSSPRGSVGSLEHN